MVLGITGNTGKPGLWEPVYKLISFLNESSYPFVLHPELARGLIADGQPVEASLAASTLSDFLQRSDIVVSFGGDGTLLNTAHQLGTHPTPILGVNYGRLGYLAHVEQADLIDRMKQLEEGDYLEDQRVVLETHLNIQTSSGAKPKESLVRALNEFTIQRTGDTGLMAIEVFVDDVLLNVYWADGLIVSTPTGSTAYSLALGGPIIIPGSGSILISPIAPHTLTVRPVVIPDSSLVRIKLVEADKPHLFTADGVHHQNCITQEGLCIQKAGNGVNLIRFKDQDHFSTLRTKLMWGARKSN